MHQISTKQNLDGIFEIPNGKKNTKARFLRGSWLLKRVVLGQGCCLNKGKGKGKMQAEAQSARSSVYLMCRIYLIISKSFAQFHADSSPVWQRLAHEGQPNKPGNGLPGRKTKQSTWGVQRMQCSTEMGIHAPALGLRFQRSKSFSMIP